MNKSWLRWRGRWSESALILSGDEIFNLGVGKYRTIPAYIEVADITPAALAYATLHALFQGSYHLFRGEAQLFQLGKGNRILNRGPETMAPQGPGTR